MLQSVVLEVLVTSTNHFEFVQFKRGSFGSAFFIYIVKDLSQRGRSLTYV